MSTSLWDIHSFGTVGAPKREGGSFMLSVGIARIMSVLKLRKAGVIAVSGALLVSGAAFGGPPASAAPAKPLTCNSGDMWEAIIVSNGSPVYFCSASIDYALAGQKWTNIDFTSISRRLYIQQYSNGGNTPCFLQRKPVEIPVPTQYAGYDEIKVTSNTSAC